MRITCDICGKPCRGQGTQGRGRNQRPATSTPTPRPTTPFIPNRHPSLVPVCSAHIHQTARNPRVHHAARPPPGTPASHPNHSCAQNADHLAQNTPHSLNFTEVVCTLGASIPNTVRSAQIHQSARNPRIHHAAQPPTNTPASHPNHSRAQNADHLAQNTPHSLNFTEVVCTLGASIPNTVRSAQIHQSARNPRVHHAARLPPDAPASYPHHSCAQNADHLAQNTPHSLNFTEVVCTLGASIPNTVRSARIRQTARNPRIRHAARPPPGTPASHPHHSCAQNADHLAQNTPYSLNFTEVVCTLGAHRTIGSTSKETQWMRIRSTPLRRTHTPPQVQTTLSAVDSLGVLSWASW